MNGSPKLEPLKPSLCFLRFLLFPAESVRLGWIVITLALACSVCLRASEPAAPRHEVPPARYVIGISPYLEKAVKDDVFRKIAGFVLEGLPVGSSLGIYDAYQIRTIATLSIPEAKAFRSGRTRVNQFQEELNRLKRFLASEPVETNRLNLPPVASVRLPQFLNFVADNPGPSGLPLVVLVLGSPLYVDPREPSFSMVEGYFPSDGHLTASREQSVFGLRERENPLTNSILHWGYFGDPWVSDIHRERVLRFWSLYAARRGSRLGTFSADLPTVFTSVARGREALGDPESRFPPASSATKVEMIRITRDTGVADWITREIASDTPSPPPPRSLTGPMKIGIRWKGDIDLDLYAAPKPGAETLFFEHPRSAEGYYFKDHRSSPRREYEFIDFENPVDARQVAARINYYAGTTERGPAGEVRIEFDGRIYSGPFELEARQGNMGRDGKSQSAHWVTIDVPGILGLGDAGGGPVRAGNR